jgi:ferritin
MLSKKMQQAINDQINAEIYSAYLYLSMRAYFESANLAGFANWMQVQYQEESFHAFKFYGYVNDRRGRVLLQAIAAPPTEWKSPLDVFKATLAHEQIVTGRINDLMSLAIQEKDHAAHMFLQWFINEQVEEEKNADTIINKLKLMADTPGGLYLLDQELAQRVYTPPAAAAEPAAP